MKMLIESFKRADVSALCALFNDARAANGNFPEQYFELSDFLKAVEGETILVARIGEEIAGFASVWEQDTFLHHLYVSPRFQRQGIGSRLLQACVKRFGLPMSLKCIESNAVACLFYERRGWRPREMADGPEGRYILYTHG